MNCISEKKNTKVTKPELIQLEQHPQAACSTGLNCAPSSVANEPLHPLPFHSSFNFNSDREREKKHDDEKPLR